MLTHISDLQNILPKTPKRLVLTAAHDQHALEAVFEARAKGLIEPILVGNEPEIVAIAQRLNFDLSDVQIFHSDDILETVQMAVSLVSEGNADILMKGKVQTPDLLRGVLNKEWGLTSGNKLSHVALFEIEKYHKLVAITDVAMNSAPDLEEKKQILNNAVGFMHSLDIPKPKVAVLAAIENINPRMKATTDAAALVEMHQKGELQTCEILGPISFDCAMSKDAANQKGIDHTVAGDADILVVPTIESGNFLYKSLNLFSNVKVAACIVGASAPIVLTSRADSEEAKFNSILLAASTC